MRFSKQEISSWPKNHKKCSFCLEIKTLESFKKESKLLFGVSSTCRQCKTSNKYRPFRRWTKEQIESWPTNHKQCMFCKSIKEFSQFHSNKDQLFGLASDCKDCRKIQSKKEWGNATKTRLNRIIYGRAKSRAKKKNIYFNLDIEDIHIPEKCPVFNEKFIYGDHNWTPSIDRINPNLGYVKGNVIIVSNKANVIKNNACPDDIIVVGEFYKNISSYTTA